MRRLIAIICIAVLIASAMAPVASHVPAAILVLLDPLFGIVISVPVAQADDAGLGTAPFIAVRSPRGPPLA